MADLAGRADNAKPTDGRHGGDRERRGGYPAPLNVSGLQIVVSAMGVETVNGCLTGGVCSSWQQNGRQRTRADLNGTPGSR